MSTKGSASPARGKKEASGKNGREEDSPWRVKRCSDLKGLYSYFFGKKGVVIIKERIGDEI